jgi:hypothetical protein
MQIKNIFLILADISGYTKFIKVHKISLKRRPRRPNTGTAKRAV